MRAAPRTITGPVLLALLAIGASGCTSDPEASTPDKSPRQSADPTVRPTPTSAPTPRPTRGPELLTATEATPPYGRFGAPSIFRTGNGTTMVIYEPTWPGQRTTYRLYDRRWRPRTPLLRLPMSLGIQRTTATDFIGSTSLSLKDGTELHNWVTVDSAGRVHEVAHQPRGNSPARPRPGDLHLEGDGYHRFAYRPSSDTVFRKPRQPWEGPGFSWYVDRGMICAMGSGSPTDGVLHISLDEGRTFTDVATAGVLPADSGPRLQACHLTKDRVVVETGGEYPRWLHTLDRTGRYLLSSRPLGDLLDPYDWGQLPDGRLVVGTRLPGVMVATDSTNRLLDRRPTPAPMSAGFDIVDDEFVVLGGGFVHVSKDAGLTWRKFDLQMP